MRLFSLFGKKLEPFPEYGPVEAQRQDLTMFKDVNWWAVTGLIVLCYILTLVVKVLGGSVHIFSPIGISGWTGAAIALYGSSWIVTAICVKWKREARFPLRYRFQLIFILIWAYFYYLGTMATLHDAIAESAGI